MTLRFVDVSPQCGCFQPYCLCLAVISTFKPRQPVRHFIDCIAQCADQLHGSSHSPTTRESFHQVALT
jgi:hypothetical protein